MDVNLCLSINPCHFNQKYLHYQLYQPLWAEHKMLRVSPNIICLTTNIYASLPVPVVYTKGAIISLRPLSSSGWLPLGSASPANHHHHQYSTLNIALTIAVHCTLKCTADSSAHPSAAQSSALRCSTLQSSAVHRLSFR